MIGFLHNQYFRFTASHLESAKRNAYDAESDRVSKAVNAIQQAIGNFPYPFEAKFSDQDRRFVDASL